MTRVDDSVPLSRLADEARQAANTTPKPTDLPGYGCDWGNCMEDAVDHRWSDEHGWLPVCAEHRS